MPPRKRIILSDEVKAALMTQLAHGYETWRRAEDDFHLEVYLLNRASVPLAEIASNLGVGHSTVGDWKKKGEGVQIRREEERSRRAVEDPLRSGE